MKADASLFSVKPHPSARVFSGRTTRAQPDLINTPLQRGELHSRMAPNRFNGLLPVDQTVETVIAVGSLFFTGLKPDVNEKHRRRYEMSRPRSRSQDGFLRHSRSALGFLLILIFCIASQSATADSAGLSVQVDQPGVAISSNLFGIFFEEINSAGDGGIYAELIRNRSFEDSTASPVYWTQLTTGL
jgi:hypothetical protein